jgi:hypothetical protein
MDKITKKKIIKETTENFLCFILDKYEGEPLFEEQLASIGYEFLNSHYSKIKG